eukprot:jgi/Mesvir1/18998/Mv18958-RA.1
MKELFVIDAGQHGAGSVVFAWNCKGSFLASAGPQRRVLIHDRSGKPYDKIPLTQIEPDETGRRVELGPRDCSCIDVKWDSSGDRVAILQALSPIVLIYNVNTKATTKVDTQMKELSVIAWARTVPILAIGTGKGNLLLYNDKLQKKIPIMGKHSRRITCGAWNMANKLALGGEDRQLTVSQQDGDTLLQTSLKAEASEICWADKKDNDRDRSGSGETTISVNVGRACLYIHKLGAGPNGAEQEPIEMAFQEKYGKVQCHQWFGDGYILLGFQSGYIVIISTHSVEMSEEVFSKKIHQTELTHLAYSSALDRAASCGGNQLKVLDVAGHKCKEMHNDSVNFPPGTRLNRVEWTGDGQVLSCSTAEGGVHTFLASLPVVNAANETKMAYLTSLMEVSVVDVLGQLPPVKIEIETEPLFCALGPAHVALGMNNQVWFYSIAGAREGHQKPLINQRDYLGTVDQVGLNERFAAVLAEGRLQLHVIEAAADPGDAESRFFPEDGHGNAGDISCVGMTASFLVWGTRKGSIHYYSIADGASVNEYRHEGGGIAKIYPNPLGTRLIFVDDAYVCRLYNPINDQVCDILDFNGSATAVLWDAFDTSCFVLVASNELHVFAYAAVTTKGPYIKFLGSQPAPPGSTPVILVNGYVTCQLGSGQLETVLLETHSTLNSAMGNTLALQKKRFEECLNLFRLKEAWECAMVIKEEAVWDALCKQALLLMDVPMATRVYRQQADAGMVLSLQKLTYVEDKNLLAGHMVMLADGDYNLAQELFLKSSQPITALDMRKDLKQWDQALKLARQLAPEQLALISREYANLLELRGEFEAALQYYEKGLQGADGDENIAFFSRAGLARCTIQLGDVRRGRKLCMELENAQLCRDCAVILENQNQMQEAAELYESGGLYEKAASIYIASKAFHLAQPLMAKISTPKLHAMYGRAKEAERKYEEAANAYEAAGDLDAVIRIHLEHLKNPQKAFTLARKSKSIEGTNMVANYCMVNQDVATAIEFLVLGKRSEDAFQLAQAHEQMDSYAAQLGTTASLDEYKRLAKYYEMRSNYGMAGRMFELCGQPGLALKLYLRCGTEQLDRAIELVGKANNDTLTGELVDFLMGESDGVPKDHSFLFRLHMALKNYTQAAKTAILIAKQEQEMGNYKIAHTQLFDTCRQLASQRMHIPSELQRMLMLLHSYILVRTLVKLNEHTSGARMLIRVANNISKFPAHIVPILTSTVIECQRSGLKKTAFEYASMLMRPEYRASINATHKRKIENIVRKPDKAEEEEPLTPCPFCSYEIPETQLECEKCKNTIPYCIASGKHMVLGDWTECPQCAFPAIGSELVKVIASEKVCPMCSLPVSLNSIVKVDDPIAKLKSSEAPLSPKAGGTK